MGCDKTSHRGRANILSDAELASPLAQESQAAEITASSIPELQFAIKTAKAGDVLILANGACTNSIAVTTSNFTVREATPGGVYLNGTNTIAIPANDVTFSGFQFTLGSIPGFVIEGLAATTRSRN